MLERYLTELKQIWSCARQVREFVASSAPDDLKKRVWGVVGNWITPLASSAMFALLVNRATLNYAVQTPDALLWLMVGGVIVLNFMQPAIISLSTSASIRMRFLLEERLELSLCKKKGELDAASYEDPTLIDLMTRVDENGPHR